MDISSGYKLYIIWILSWRVWVRGDVQNGLTIWRLGAWFLGANDSLTLHGDPDRGHPWGRQLRAFLATETLHEAEKAESLWKIKCCVGVRLRLFWIKFHPILIILLSKSDLTSRWIESRSPVERVQQPGHALRGYQGECKRWCMLLCFFHGFPLESSSDVSWSEEFCWRDWLNYGNMDGGKSHENVLVHM